MRFTSRVQLLMDSGTWGVDLFPTLFPDIPFFYLFLSFTSLSLSLSKEKQQVDGIEAFYYNNCGDIINYHTETSCINKYYQHYNSTSTLQS